MEFAALLAIAALIFFLIFAVKVFRGGNKNVKDVAQRQVPVPIRQRDGAPRRAQLARNRGVRARNGNLPLQEDVFEDEEQNPLANKNKKAEIPDGKLGAKKRAKLEAKAEKKAHREAEEQLRAEKRNKEQIAEMERKKVAEKDREDTLNKEEEERKAREERERRDQEEYLKMKEAFSIEEEGFEEREDSEENLLHQFLDYIKQNKVVIIEDLAAHFNMKTQMAIDRIKGLQKDDILTGVIDDRGKFIYITLEEMEVVSKFIRQRGRVTIAELVEDSNNLINLIPHTPPHS